MYTNGFLDVAWCFGLCKLGGSLAGEYLPSLGCHSSCALTVHVIGLLVFATVFFSASAFNGDLHQWDVAEVTDMYRSKSIRIV